MKIKKDIFLDILYSVFFTIVMLFADSSLSSLDETIVQVFKNFVLIGILLLWLKALSRNNDGIVLVIDKSSSQKYSIKSGLSLIKGFIEMKIGVFVLVFVVASFFLESITTSQSSAFLIQIFAVCLYTLSSYLISLAYLKISIDDWKFLVLILSPYFLFFIIYEILNLENTLYFALIPSNSNLLLYLHSGFLVENVVILVLSGLFSLVMIAGIFMSIRKLSDGRKYYRLPIERSN